MRNKVDTISKYYEDSLEEQLDEKKIKDLLAGMEKVKATFQTLDFLEKAVKAEEVRDKRAKDLGRVVELAAFTSPPPKERFKMKKADNKMPVDPFERAEYLYSLIESEE